MTTESRHTYLNGRILRTLWIQEKKSSTFQNMKILDGVSWHPHCVPEVERPGLDRVLTHAEK